MIKTVSLTADTETKVEISGGYNVGVINRTTGMLYASRNSGISAGADDVAAIPAGDSYVIRAADDTVYLLATAAGDVQLESIGAKEVFKTAATRTSSGGGESGGTVDDVARQAISSHAGNAEIHVTATEKTAWNNKAELSDIPTSLPANGGNADTLDGKHAIDFVENYLNDNYHFAIMYGDHAYITNYVDADIPNLPAVSNYMHIVGRNADEKVEVVLSIGIDYTKDVYIYQLGSWRKINDGGNADTIDGFHANSFFHSKNIFTNADDCNENGVYHCAPSAANVPIPADSYGLLKVYKNADGTWWEQQISQTDKPAVRYTRHWVNDHYTDWINDSDGGNAATLEGKTVAEFVLKSEYDALAARVAALESKN